MNSYGRRIACASLLCVFAGALAPIATAAEDWKAFSPTVCQPLGPNTTVTELTLNVSGLYNPGTTNETVMCPLMTDGETAWDFETEINGKLRVHYKAGSVAGKVYCTLYTGSGAVNVGPIYTTSYNPANAVAGTRDSFELLVAESSQMYTTSPQVNLLCTISPKATLGTIFLWETSIQTNIP
jgi:hypothetical protein